MFCKELGDGSIVAEIAEVRFLEVAIVGVPADVAFEESESVAEAMQPAQQRAEGGGMPVAPR